MSIIERMTELLGTAAQPDRKPPAPDAGGDISGLDLIERAAGGRLDIREMRYPEARTAVEARPARSAGAAHRILKIDVDRLWRQGMITPDGERTHIAESFRQVKRHVLANVAKPKEGVSANLVLVTSAMPGEGKTFCAINLAISIALERDHSVLLVDADVAKPSIPNVLGVDAKRGLLDLLLDRRVELDEVLCGTTIRKLTLLPAGTAHHHATELLASDAMRALLHDLATGYPDRIVIFDSPPLLAASEGAVLANQMGQVVMIVEAGRTTEAALKEALGCIESSNVGLLLNKGDGARPGYGYGGYGYGAK